MQNPTRFEKLNLDIDPLNRRLYEIDFFLELVDKGRQEVHRDGDSFLEWVHKEKEVVFNNNNNKLEIQGCIYFITIKEVSSHDYYINGMRQILMPDRRVFEDCLISASVFFSENWKPQNELAVLIDEFIDELHAEMKRVKYKIKRYKGE